MSEYTSINLDRFYGDFEVYKYGGDDLKFNVYFEECRAIQNIFGFPEIWRSVSNMEGTYLHIMFDIDLSENIYPKLADIISKNTAPLDMRISLLESRLATLQQIVMPEYKYLAFYGEGLRSQYSKPTFQELELELHDGTFIKNGSVAGIQNPPIPTYAWQYWSGNDAYSDVFDGLKPYGTMPHLQFKFENYSYGDRSRVIFYFDCTTKRGVKTGTYWTYPDTINSFDNGKMYGTNKDPTSFADPSRPGECTFICNSEKIGQS